jgi:hypothetical protein
VDGQDEKSVSPKIPAYEGLDWEFWSRSSIVQTKKRAYNRNLPHNQNQPGKI